VESLAELQERLSEIPKCAAALSTVFINTRLETSLDLGRSGEGTRCRLSADFQHVLDSNSKPNKHSYFSQIFVSISPNFPTQTRVLLAVCWEEDVLNSDICLRLVSHNVAKSAGEGRLQGRSHSSARFAIPITLPSLSFMTRGAEI